MREYFVWLAKLLTLVVIIFLVVPFIFMVTIFTGAELMSTSSDDMPADPARRVAVIELDGMIENSKEITRDLQRAAERDDVKAIVLRINSPGGAVGPSQDIYTTVARIKRKKPVVASMGAVAASGGLYAALPASQIYAQPGTLTGSIGVVLHLPNVRRLTDSIGVDMVTIKSGALKDVGNSFREMTEHERNFLQTTIDTAYQEFVRAVAESRDLPQDAVTAFADGRLLLGSQAKEVKLVDEIGDLYDAARAALALAGAPLGEDQQPHLFYPSEKFKGLTRILEGAAQVSTLLSPRMELRYVLH